jgi:molybdenum cofactor cytidylyltransferase
MRAFAIIPAAGTSSRMGRPKLLLPIGGRPLILHTLAAWQNCCALRVIVVVRPDDEALAEVVRAAGADVVIPPAAPPDMKASLCYGLAHIEQHFQPTAGDAWLVAPADMPGLSPRIIAALLTDFSTNSPGRVIVPTLAGRRGHPVLLPWSLAAQLRELPASEGLNALIERSQPYRLPCDHLEPAAGAFADIDTPDDLIGFSHY